MKTYAYKIATDLTEAQLNELGADGWELISSHWEPRPTAVSAGAGYGGGGGGYISAGWHRLTLRKQLSE